jgi:phenylacetate-CoA ligase
MTGAESRQYWNVEAESLLNTPQVRKIQLAKLQRLLCRLYDVKPFWRQRMDGAGIRPDKLKSLDEYSERMPIVDKALRRQLIEESGGDVMQMVDRMIAVPVDQVVLMAATSGTTGEPTPYPHTRKDIEIFGELFARLAWRTGIRPGDRIVHAFGLSMWLAGVPYVQFFQRVGACVLPVGAEGGSERLLRFAKQFRANTIFGTPSLIEHLIDRAVDVIGSPVRDLGIKTILCAGEPGAGVPEVRAKIEQAYGGRLFDHGGAMGISCDFAEYQGMHHIADDYIFFELVDPETREPIPFEHGARGMPVQTTLEHEGMLWVRECFGDIFEIFTEPCPCGRTGFRYKVIGRADDMLKVKGVMVYPASIDGVITGFCPRVTGEFRIVLTERPPRVVPPLKLKVEYGVDVKARELDALAKEIEEKMHARLKITPKIIWVPPNSLPRAAGKTNFFERLYEA